MGASCCVLVASWGVLLRFGCVLEASCGVLGASWVAKITPRGTWLGNEREARLYSSAVALFGYLLFFQHWQTVRIVARVYSFTLRSLRALRALARCACTTVICFIRVRLLPVRMLRFSQFFFSFSKVLLRFFFGFSCFSWFCSWDFFGFLWFSFS